MKNIYTFRESYDKASAIIKSCNTFQQLKAAKKYVNLFFKFHSSSYPSFLNKNVLEADYLLVKKYDKLFSKIRKKEKSLKKL